MTQLLQKLDLEHYVKSLEGYFSRPKKLFIEGDQNRHYEMIKALDTLSFNPPPKVASFETLLKYVRKQGVVSLEMLYELVKVLRYFKYLQKCSALPDRLYEWFESIEIPQALDELDAFFNEDGTINDSLDEELLKINQLLGRSKKEIQESLNTQLQNQKLQEYLVDRQIHLYKEHETLLCRAGFNHALKGSIIGRSANGFFYVEPESIRKIKEQSEYFIQEKEAILYRYAKHFSKLLATWERFVLYIDKQFELFDHYQARVLFARDKNYEFVKSQKGERFILNEFAHPALHEPKAITIDASKRVILITGVNAGGKTMLLKSLLSSVYMAKYLLPMRIKSETSVIPHFKAITAIIDDPQNVNHDISTFAGRMVEFSKILSQKDMLIGVDEIELGTDSDEAASLFKVLLEALIEKGSKIILTTHHKRLAALMADREDVELVAALYDELNRKPLYEFLQGSIGKSYAFETALRYGIHNSLVKKAMDAYGKDQEKLSLLIERSSELERSLKQKHKEIDAKLEHIKKLEQIVEDEREHLHRDVMGTKVELSRAYTDAIKEAKQAAKAHRLKETHRHMNKAHNKLPKKPLASPLKEAEIKVGDRVKYLTNFGEVLSLDGKVAHVGFESGMKMRIKRSELKKAKQLKVAKKEVKVSKPKANSMALKLDLHGLRSDEAIEKLDQFLSDALLQGWDEVIVYHGIGTGKLAFAVDNYLKQHPKVLEFSDAPPNLGGYGAKLVKL